MLARLLAISAVRDSSYKIQKTLNPILHCPSAVAHCSSIARTAGPTAERSSSWLATSTVHMLAVLRTRHFHNRRVSWAEGRRTGKSSCLSELQAPLSSRASEALLREKIHKALLVASVSGQEVCLMVSRTTPSSSRRLGTCKPSPSSLSSLLPLLMYTFQTHCLKWRSSE